MIIRGIGHVDLCFSRGLEWGQTHKRKMPRTDLFNLVRKFFGLYGPLDKLGRRVYGSCNC